MPDSFVHLHLHSEYSLIDGLVRLEPLVKAVYAEKMPALAVTEQGNFFSLVKFYRLAQQYGIKPIAGVEIKIIDEHEGFNSSNLLLFCQDQDGYKNLTSLITKSYREGQFRGFPFVKYSWLKDAADGLIALSCARDGNVGQAIINGNYELAKKNLSGWLELFPDRFYIELQRTGRSGEDNYVSNAIDLATTYAVPVVATNDVRFLKREDYEAHEARVCIQQGSTLNDPKRFRGYSEQQYLRSVEEMVNLFQDIPEAIENTLLIAQRCNLELSFGEAYLPHFPIPENYDQDSWLRHETEKGLTELIETNSIGDDVDHEVYRNRLKTELDVIINMGFSGYFLIVADFIRWAKNKKIPVGPGRGSGAGSLVAYVLGITELEPMKYDLLFERFLNPERVSLPDFDIDFCMERRDEVIDYVADKYGHERVSQIITYGSMAAKAVVRDVGRVLGHPYGFVDQIAKLIPFELNITLDSALKNEEVLKQRYKEEEEVRILIDLAKKLEGLARNAGKHAGGIVIAPKPLIEYMPLYCEQGSAVTSTQFDMSDVEAIGLVKFDFLGLRTLTIIDWAVNDANHLLEAENKNIIDIKKIPLDDQPTFDLIRKTDTTAIFQLESDGMKRIIKRLQPDSFDDLIALVALFRPGPLQSGMVDDYIDRKHGAKVKYPHPALENVLNPTHGVILYQEQVMQIAQILAGYTLGSADLLRRAMGKKKPEEMAQQRSIFIEGAVAKGVKQGLASDIFDLMEKFAGYGFNKSHSAAYALLAYQTAWLKAHYPAAFMAAVLSSDMDNTDKIVSLRHDLMHMQISLLPPSINESKYKFTVSGEMIIRFGLGAIKGVGLAVIENILSEREKHGEFQDLFDFCRRIDSRKVNKRVLNALIRSGASDGLGPSRSVMSASIDKAMRLAEQISKNSDVGQDDMFGLNTEGDSNSHGSASFVDADEWNESKRLLGEKETLGFYLQGHPIQGYESELMSSKIVRLKDVTPGQITVVGYIENVRIPSGPRGKMGVVTLDDNTSRMTVRVYSDEYNKFRHLLLKDKLIVVGGKAIEHDFNENEYAINAEKIYELQEYRSRNAKLRLRVKKDEIDAGFFDRLRSILAQYKNGNGVVYIDYYNEKGMLPQKLGDSWRVDFADELLQKMESEIGHDNVSLIYE